MPASTAEDIYQIAKQLPMSERLRLVEKIAHDLVLPPTHSADSRAAPPSGIPGRVHLIGQVTDLALDPPRFMMRTSHGLVRVEVVPHLLDAARSVWGKEALVGVDDVVDADGTIHDAVAVTVETALVADDPLSIFESTFGSGAELWSSQEGREQLEGMRGGS